MPEKYCFSTGIITDYKEMQSRQVDIIIHDKFNTPYLADMSGIKIIPIESVYGVIEVKSVLTKSEIGKCVENIESVRKLEKNTIEGMFYPTAGLVFAYDSDASLETVYKNFVELSEKVELEKRISCVCVLNKGIILPVDKNGMNKVELLPNENTIYAMFNNAPDALLLFYLVLYEILSSIVIFPANMVAYAKSSGMLDASFSIPAGYTPDDAIINVLGNTLSMADIRALQNYGKKCLVECWMKKTF